MPSRPQLRYQPEIKIQVDLNTTRVAAQYGLLNTELKLNRLLRLYMSVHNDAPQITISEWDTIAEIEGALNNVQQNKKHEITHQNIKIRLHADSLCTPQQTLSIQTARPSHAQLTNMREKKAYNW